MAFISTDQKLKVLERAIDEHSQLLIDQNKDLKSQKDITFFFTIIVSVTLVGTLVGLGGLYINAFNQSKNYKIDKEEIFQLQKNLDENKQQISEYKMKMEVLKSKYPWIKEINQ